MLFVLAMPIVLAGRARKSEVELALAPDIAQAFIIEESEIPEVELSIYVS